MADIELDPRIAKYIQNMEEEKQEANLRRMNAENNLSLVSNFSGSDKERNLVEFQLDLDKELDQLFHFFAGHEIRINEKNKEYWADTDDDRLKILSNYGVKFLMKIIKSLCNKHIILGFYDEERVMFKSKDFSNDLNDWMFENYEYILHYPSPEDLQERYRPLIKDLGLDITDEELYERCLIWSEEQCDSKYTHIRLLHTLISNLVEATYRRAYLGLERKSLGDRNININQSPMQNNIPLVQEKKGWLR